MELHAHLEGHSPLPIQPYTTLEEIPVSVQTDFREIIGQEHGKRALEVAAAGGHNIFMPWTKNSRICSY
jgi:magnesium chelatase family protein